MKSRRIIVFEKISSILSKVLDHCITEVVDPKANEIWEWVLDALHAPFCEVPVLFVSFNYASDSPKLFGVLNDVAQEKTRGEKFVHLSAPQCPNGSTMLENILELLGKPTRLRASRAPSAFLHVVRQLGEPIVILISNCEQLSTPLLLFFIEICFMLRSNESPVRIALILGLNASTAQSLQQSWPSDILLKIISTGVHLCDVKEVIEKYVQILEGLPELSACFLSRGDFLEYSENYPIESVFQRLLSYVKLTLAVTSTPLLLLPICIIENEREDAWSKGQIQICLKQKNEKDVKDGLRTVYRELVAKSWAALKSKLDEKKRSDNFC